MAAKPSFALELARDEEARAAGVEGADLADAILATARFNRLSLPAAALTGEAAALKDRIDRLLAPLKDTPRLQARTRGALPTAALSLLSAFALGALRRARRPGTIQDRSLEERSKFDYTPVAQITY